MTDKYHDDSYEYNVTDKPYGDLEKTEYLLYARYEVSSYY